MEEAAVWTTQELWPIVSRAQRTVLLVLVSPESDDEIAINDAFFILPHN